MNCAVAIQYLPMDAASDEETISHAPWPAPFTAEEKAAWGLTEDVRAYVNARHDLITAGRALRSSISALKPSDKVAFVVSAKTAEAERKKTQDEIARLEGFLRTVEAKLGNETFLSKAPAAIVEQQKARKAELLADLERKRALLASLG